MKTQARIGLIFSLFSLMLFGLKVFLYLDAVGSLNGFFTIDRVSYLVYAIAFGYGIFWINTLAKIFQIGILTAEGLISLSYYDDIFAGFLLLLVAIFLLASYRFFARHFLLKASCIASVLYALLIVFPFANARNKFVSSLEWLLLIAGFIALCYIIFKEHIDKIKAEKDKSIEVAKEAARIAREAISIQKYGDGRDTWTASV